MKTTQISTIVNLFPKFGTFERLYPIRLFFIIALSFTFYSSSFFAQNVEEFQPTLADSIMVIDLLERGGIGNTDQALILSKNIGYYQGEKKALKQLSGLYKSSGKSALALRYSLQRIDLLAEMGTETESFEAQAFAGEIYYAEKLYENALSYFNKAERLKSSDEISKVVLWEKMGQSYRQTEQPDSALFFLKQAFNYYTSNKNPEGQLRTMQAQAHIFDEKNDCQNAMNQNQKIRDLVRELGKVSLLATTYNNLGYNYHCLDDYKNAIRNFEIADSLCQSGCDLDKMALHSNLGIALFNDAQFENAVKQLNKAIDYSKSSKNQKEQAYLTHLKSSVYLKKGDLYQSQIFNQEAMRKAQKINAPNVLSDTYKLAADIHQSLYEYEDALEYYQKHLALRDSILREDRLRQQELAQQQFLLERAEKEIKLLLADQELKDLAIKQLQTEKDRATLEKDNLELQNKQQEAELENLRQQEEITASRLKAQELEAERNRQQLLLSKQAEEAAQKDKSIAELRLKEETQRLELLQKEADEMEREAEIESLNQKQKIDQLQIERQQSFMQFALGLGIALLAILGLILFSFFNARKKNRLLAQQNQEIEAQKTEIEKSRDVIEQERAKSEDLLLNVLPAATAKELKETGAATPRHYKKVSVLFTDFAGFTNLSAQMPPEEIIEELNTCFLAFDEIIEGHNLEKIKTVGDAYMCAGGLPEENDTNPVDTVSAAIEMKNYISSRRAAKLAEGKPYWDMRVGVHTGEVVAGVVGSKKFAYDIWGDTVNTASRMETNGEGGKVNISQTTYELVKDHFDCKFRGTLPVKDKGEVAMYFVSKPKLTLT